MYQHLLVPVGDTDARIEAIGHATEFAHAVGARITFLHVSPVGGEVGAPRWHGDGRAHEWLARAEAGARAQGVPCASVCIAGDDSLDAIIAHARQHGCDLVCTSASPTPTATTAMNDRMSDALRPAVLSCETDERPAVTASIGALLHAHRTLAETLHECLDTIGAAAKRGEHPSVETMREIVRRLHRLSAGSIHAKRKAALFRRLRKRTSRVNAELAELERLHQRDDDMLHELARMVGRESHDAPAPELVEASLFAYARTVHEWMGREQGVILPAARRYLSYADWAEIDWRFGSAGLVSETAKHDTASGAYGPRASTD
ncbi:universal stress protein [Caballeronia sp. LZ019]|uniref:universal stress protein n=1 Tax=Caballeronia sp. LZ019 TaxID=3038555 RepID=UPI0028651BFB|nr:universal stress protein [Caballeronia sp. LZ019]MDR5806914.1 universal stress protein [Caballeronia sp. LZ019]